MNKNIEKKNQNKNIYKSKEIKKWKRKNEKKLSIETNSKNWSKLIAKNTLAIEQLN